ncbi:MAG: hypothetical protein P1U34_03995 [Coxiellaceae bacterium]|nr:hypothetical protein [Coxiellaceae bacterium]
MSRLGPAGFEVEKGKLEQAALVEKTRGKLKDANTDLIFAENDIERAQARVAIAQAEKELAMLLLEASDFDKPKYITKTASDSHIAQRKLASEWIAEANVQLQEAVTEKNPALVAMALSCGASPFSVSKLKGTSPEASGINYLLTQYAVMLFDDYKARVNAMLPYLELLKTNTEKVWFKQRWIHVIEPGLDELKKLMALSTETPDEQAAMMAALSSVCFELKATFDVAGAPGVESVWVHGTYGLGGSHEDWPCEIKYVGKLATVLAQQDFGQLTRPVLANGKAREVEQRFISESFHKAFPGRRTINEMQEARRVLSQLSLLSGGGRGASRGGDTSVDASAPVASPQW